MYRCALPLVLAFLTASCGAPPSARRAQGLLDKGDYGGAEREADVGLQQFPKDPSLWKIKLSSLMLRGSNQDAVAEYRKWYALRSEHHDNSSLRAMAKTVLWQSLRLPAPEVRVAAIQAIERMEVEELANQVADRLADDEAQVAAAAAVAILRSHPQAGEVAQEMLQSSDAKARAIVISGAARKLKAKARPQLIAALGDKDAQVRRRAASGLAGLHTREDTEALLKALADRDDQVRARALRSLSRGKRKVPVDTVARFLDDSYVGAQIAAVEFLDAMGGDVVKGHLVRASASKNLLLAMRATVALFRLGEGDGSALVQQALDDDAWTVRASALNQMTSAVPRNAALRFAGVGLADARLDVRLAAARALVRLKSRDQAMRVFGDALAAPRANLRLSAALELARLGDARGKTALGKLATSPDLSVRSAAISAHGGLRHVSEGLVQALADESATRRVQAAEAILRAYAD